MLHPVGCLYYCVSDARSHKHQNGKECPKRRRRIFIHGESPKRKHTTFTARQKFEIKNFYFTFLKFNWCGAHHSSRKQGLVQAYSTLSLRETCCPQHSVVVPAETFETRQCHLLTLSVAKRREKAKTVPLVSYQTANGRYNCRYDETHIYSYQYLTNLMHKICFTISFISCLYMFRAHVLETCRGMI